jgi:hypothetical protein
MNEIGQYTIYTYIMSELAGIHHDQQATVSVFHITPTKRWMQTWKPSKNQRVLLQGTNKLVKSDTFRTGHCASQILIAVQSKLDVFIRIQVLKPPTSRQDKYREVTLSQIHQWCATLEAESKPWMLNASRPTYCLPQP